MKSVQALIKDFGDGEVDFVSIFSSILIDLPVGQYFRAFLDQKIMLMKINEGGQGDENMSEAAQLSQMIYKDSAAEVTAQLKKIWLTQFHRWIMHPCHETTQEKMNELLCAESDWETL